VTPEEKDFMNKLCEQIADEKDPERFNNLVRQLDELFKLKAHRIEDNSPNPLSTQH
jgi:hypothetical protein